MQRNSIDKYHTMRYDELPDRCLSCLANVDNTSSSGTLLILLLAGPLIRILRSGFKRSSWTNEFTWSAKTKKAGFSLDLSLGSTSKPKKGRQSNSFVECKGRSKTA